MGKGLGQIYGKLSANEDLVKLPSKGMHLYCI